MDLNPTQIHQWLTEPTQNQQWLIPNLLPSGGLTLLSGPPKRGNKTYISLIATIGLAANRKVLKQEKVNKKNVPTLFIEEEGASHDLKNRINMVINGYKLNNEVVSSMPLFWLYRKRAKLNNFEHRSEIIKYVIENKIQLVVIDTLSSTFSGDENDVKEVNSAMETVYGITAQNCAVLMLVHQKKAVTDKMDIDDALRGSSHIAASYDQHIAVIGRRDLADGNGYDLRLRIRSRTQEEREGGLILKFDQDSDGKDRATGALYIDEEGKDKFKALALQDFNMEKNE